MWSINSLLVVMAVTEEREAGVQLKRRERHLGVSKDSGGRIFRIHRRQSWWMAGDTEIPVPGHVN